MKKLSAYIFLVVFMLMNTAYGRLYIDVNRDKKSSNSGSRKFDSRTESQKKRRKQYNRRFIDPQEGTGQEQDTERTIEAQQYQGQGYEKKQEPSDPYQGQGHQTQQSTTANDDSDDELKRTPVKRPIIVRPWERKAFLEEQKRKQQKIKNAKKLAKESPKKTVESAKPDTPKPEAKPEKKKSDTKKTKKAPEVHEKDSTPPAKTKKPPKLKENQQASPKSGN
jgi:hypothetical protein